jgi:hypothetical protein
VEPSEVEKMIGDLEIAVDRLRSLYEQYFMGFEKLEPQVPRKDVDRKIHLLRKEQFRNTALRFRFQMILQRYNTYQPHWQRICREIENGTYKRHLSRAHQRFGGGVRRVSSIPPPTLRPEPPASPAAASPFASLPRLPDLPPDLAAELAELDREFAPAAAPPIRMNPGASREPAAARSAAIPGAPAIPPQSPPAPAGPPRAAPVVLRGGVSPSPLPPRPAPRVGGPPGPPPIRPATTPAAPSAPNRPPPAPPPVPARAPPPVPAAPLAPAAAPPVRGGAPAPHPAGPLPASHPATASPPTPPEPPRAPPPRPVPKTPPPPRPPLPSSAAVSPPPAPPRSSGELPEERVRQLYSQYVETRRKQNEPTAAVTFDAVSRSLRESSAKLQEKHGKAVDFEVIVRDGKAALKPIIR